MLLSYVRDFLQSFMDADVDLVALWTKSFHRNGCANTGNATFIQSERLFCRYFYSLSKHFRTTAGFANTEEQYPRLTSEIFLQQ